MSLNTRLNILFLNAQEMDIQAWANLHQIPPELVKTGQVTLNQGAIHFENLTLPKKQTPLLLLVREGKTHVVDLGKI